MWLSNGIIHVTVINIYIYILGYIYCMNVLRYCIIFMYVCILLE